MPIDRRGLFTPNFYPDQPMGWQPMGDNQQINIAPAVGAFKNRFMSNRGDMGNVPNPTANDVPEMDATMPANAGGARKGTKSL
jgi:hypothetical protein